MINIKVQDYTKKPLTVMGMLAKECYDTQLKDENHAMRIAKHCINSGHGRNMEFADVTLTISGISARMGRELYTHIIGTSRTQASTRYITYNDFDYVIPKGMNNEQQDIYVDTMKGIAEGYKKLKDMGLKNDITGYMLPLSMTTTINLKINVRALEHLANVRMCTRALLEFRDFMEKLKVILGNLDEEWEWIVNTLMIPKCYKLGYCDEDYGCGIKSKKKDIMIINKKSVNFREE
ncbi:MAG: FAD-dependent thymidylate synthase [Cetobacterium sp.]